MKHKIFLLCLRISSSNLYFSGSLLFSIINAKPGWVLMMLCSPCLNLCSRWWRCWRLAWMVRTQLPTPCSDLGHRCAVVQFWNCFCYCPGTLIGIGQYFYHLFSVCKPQGVTWPTHLGIQLLICFTAWSLLKYILVQESYTVSRAITNSGRIRSKKTEASVLICL